MHRSSDFIPQFDGWRAWMQKNKSVVSTGMIEKYQEFDNADKLLSK